MSGGTSERTAGYVANGHGNLKGYGGSLTQEENTLRTSSTKYTTVYPHSSNDKNGASTDIINTLSQENYDLNDKIYGDGIREMSTQGTSNKNWNSDSSIFPALYGPFTVRGGYYTKTSNTGLYAFNRANGSTRYDNGFRAVLCAQ